MRKIIILMFIIAVLSSFVLAEEVNLDFNNLGQDQLDLMAQEMQEQELPGVVGVLFGDQRVNIYLSLDNGENIVLGVITEDGMVKTIRQDEISRPSLNIYTSAAAINEIQNSDDSLAALKQAMDDGRVSYRAIGFFNKMKFSVVSLFSGISKADDERVAASNTVVAVGEVVEELEEEASEDETSDDSANDNGDETEDSEEENEDSEEVPVGGLLTGGVVADIPSEPESEIHYVQLIEGGFSTSAVNINVGDTVEWENVRYNDLVKKGFVVGSQLCRGLRSKVFMPGGSYSYTFEEPVNCLVVDAIFATQTMKVVVEE